jgi:predicted nuclease of predicted toxin-antitoxin system
VTRFLLDANLSHRVARHLEHRLAIDVISLQGRRLGELSDREVIAMARREARIIITMDRDFSDFFLSSTAPGVGVIYLKLPRELRRIPAINRILEQFLADRERLGQLKQSLVVLTEESSTIHDRGEGERSPTP